jgi:hypothetical protein
MRITEQDLMEFVASGGAALTNVSMEDIRFVGIERLLTDAASQVRSSTAFIPPLSTQMQAVEHTDPQEALMDYFCDGGFDRLFDDTYMFGI